MISEPVVSSWACELLTFKAEIIYQLSEKEVQNNMDIMILIQGDTNQYFTFEFLCHTCDH